MTATVLNGATAMACFAVELFFVRFWSESRERLFACLGVGFWIFALNYAALGVLPVFDESRAYVFGVRLLGFAAVIVGVALNDRQVIERFRDDAQV
jgi:hypothetical protein